MPTTLEIRQTVREKIAWHKRIAPKDVHEEALNAMCDVIYINAVNRAIPAMMEDFLGSHLDLGGDPEELRRQVHAVSQDFSDEIDSLRAEIIRRCQGRKTELTIIRQLRAEFTDGIMQPTLLELRQRVHTKILEHLQQLQFTYCTADTVTRVCQCIALWAFDRRSPGTMDHHIEHMSYPHAREQVLHVASVVRELFAEEIDAFGQTMDCLTNGDLSLWGAYADPFTGEGENNCKI
jgi:hypothetical protein